MIIRDVTIPVVDAVAAGAFFRDVLDLPTTGDESTVHVEIGTSQLTLTPDEFAAGAHHLAFEVSTSQFAEVAAWLRARVETISVDGSDLITGPPGWRSTSLYFLGPEGMVLEAITREARVPQDSDDALRFVAVSEIGLGVIDVSAARSTAEDVLGLSPYFLSRPVFEPLGDHNGLLIVVDRDRVWFPTSSAKPGRAALTATLDSAAGTSVMLDLADGVLHLSAR
ncbi:MULTISPECIES: VOC family protein [unclassified Rhodococcus (in: high G+C Gram-positive bacteria)]|uniref:VOC family protein n=1 Tax=unclassified Rhodococcus (in: high G+C Gram-positive bacteria) TaxID=192944 RepID=UPI0006FC79E0|nr:MULTISPECIES: glyoxalase/bleomycin resistance/dioxygenase family protein [unclassified Rhodococcus (in: high G+C Gram-positive bacteria)]KQU29392.1 hypothetical protein ASG69_06870 [Rhodococcus sp. Leaf225]KQU41145.1 hypothetical protein ASH03_19485 [Rhodococcus sp. Leaf258]